MGIKLKILGKLIDMFRNILEKCQYLQLSPVILEKLREIYLRSVFSSSMICTHVPNRKRKQFLIVTKSYGLSILCCHHISQKGKYSQPMYSSNPNWQIRKWLKRGKVVQVIYFYVFGVRTTYLWPFILFSSDAYGYLWLITLSSR